LQYITLNQKYQILQPIGQGGFGRTYLVESEGKRYVVKQFAPSSLLQGEAINEASRLFQQEAKQLAQLDHQQIPKFVEAWEKDGEQFIAQEYIPGLNLEQEIHANGLMSEQEVEDVINQGLNILNDLHHHNLIHRDIKPANIIRHANTGKLYLVDFGATKRITDTVIGKTGTMIGTPQFVSPEQARGKAVFASDLYSLGATAIYLLTKTTTFDWWSVEEAEHDWKKCLKEPISDRLSSILQKLIEQGTSRRYKTAIEVLQDLKKQDRLAHHRQNPALRSVDNCYTFHRGFIDTALERSNAPVFELNYFARYANEHWAESDSVTQYKQSGFENAWINKTTQTVCAVQLSNSNYGLELKNLFMYSAKYPKGEFIKSYKESGSIEWLGWVKLLATPIAFCIFISLFNTNENRDSPTSVALLSTQSTTEALSSTLKATESEKVILYGYFIQQDKPDAVTIAPVSYANDKINGLLTGQGNLLSVDEQIDYNQMTSLQRKSCVVKTSTTAQKILCPLTGKDSKLWGFVEYQLLLSDGRPTQPILDTFSSQTRRVERANDLEAIFLSKSKAIYPQY
jgi:serine/threonine protein kinase